MKAIGFLDKDGRRLVSGGSDAMLHLWDVRALAIELCFLLSV